MNLFVLALWCDCGNEYDDFLNEEHRKIGRSLCYRKSSVLMFWKHILKYIKNIYNFILFLKYNVNI